MLPLEGVRVVAVEQYGAGPWATLHLADLGAEVIKIENPRVGGDVGRTIPPYAGDQDSLFFQTFNRNKKSLALDIASEEGRHVLLDLIEVSDAVFSNLRGDVPEKLGLQYEDLRSVNPKIVCCSLSAYGQRSVRASEPGYDYVLQGRAGWMAMTGGPDAPPTRTGPSLVDYSGGYVAALSLLAGLHQASRTGEGMDCDVSLFDTAISLLTYVGTWTLTEDYRYERTPMSSHPSIFPFQAFEASDGWIVIACAKPKFWTKLLEAMNLQEVARNPRYADFEGRLEHRDELNQILATVFLARPQRHWIELLEGAGVPVGPVNDVAEALEDPLVAERDLIAEFEHVGRGTVRTPYTAVNVKGLRAKPEAAPALGGNQFEILTNTLGYTSAQISRLAAAGAFGDSKTEGTEVSSG